MVDDEMEEIAGGKEMGTEKKIKQKKQKSNELIVKENSIPFCVMLHQHQFE